MMIFLTWEINLQSLIKSEYESDELLKTDKETVLRERWTNKILKAIIERAQRENDSEGHITLEEDEKRAIESRHFLPVLRLDNRISQESSDGIFGGKYGTIRIYGGEEGRTGIMQVKEYTVSCHQRFDLRSFPFDILELQLSFRLLHPQITNQFCLKVNVVQFSRISLHHSEWIVHTPVVTLGSPSYACSTISLYLERQTGYYYTNVFAMLTLLSALGLVAFMVDPAKEQGNRAIITITLMLSAFAFRFSINEFLPAVSYSTHMDYYILGTIYLLALITFLCLFPSWISDDESLMFAVNLALGLLCAALQVAFTLWWLVRGFNLVNAHELTKRIEITEKNWYTYRYHDTEFMTEMTADNQFFIPKKPSLGDSAMNILRRKLSTSSINPATRA